MVDCPGRSQTYEKHSGGAKRQGADSPRERPFRLPHDTLRTLLLMYLRGRLHADAGMWAGVVVECDKAGYTLQRVLIRLEASLAVDDLGLEDAVHTFCDGIVRGLVVLRHRDPDAVLLQLVRIGVAAVLYAPVRVMDEPLEFIGCSLSYGHPKSLHRVFCLQCLRQAPAHDLVRVGVRNQVQVAAVVHQVDVRDVAYPELIGACGHEATDEVLVLVVPVVRVRRVTGLGALLRQLEVTQQLQESITSGHPVTEEHPLRHQPQFVVADTGIHLANLLHCVHDAHDAEEVLLVTFLLLVIRLFAPVKQLTAIRYRVARIAVQALYCLTPAFFRTLIPCSSMTSMSVLSARFLSWLYFSCFSSFSICLR